MYMVCCFVYKPHNNNKVYLNISNFSLEAWANQLSLGLKTTSKPVKHSLGQVEIHQKSSLSTTLK